MTTPLRRSVLAFAVVGVLSASSLASAHISNFRLKDTGRINPDGSVTVSGRLTCSPGEWWRVNVTVVQEDPATRDETFRGRGGDKGVCRVGDTTVRWRARTAIFSGTAVPGEATVTARARSFAVGNRPAPELHGETKTIRRIVELQG